MSRLATARFGCVWSREAPAAESAAGARGSLMTVTATFGMCLAAECIRAIVANGRESGT